MPESGPKGRSAPVSVRESKVHGRGVFAERAFAVGEVVLEIDDSDPVLDRGRWTSEQEIFIDVFVGIDGNEKTTWMKSPEKFINHSCEPNTYVLTDRRSAVRRNWPLKNLREGDELTGDYALNIWEEWIGPVACHGGAEGCRRSIRGNYFTLRREIQRKYLPFLDGPFKTCFAKEIQSLQLGAAHDPGGRARRT